MAEEKIEKKKTDEVKLTQIATQVGEAIQLPNDTVATNDNLLPALAFLINKVLKLEKALV